MKWRPLALCILISSSACAQKVGGPRAAQAEVVYLRTDATMALILRPREGSFKSTPAFEGRVVDGVRLRPGRNQQGDIGGAISDCSTSAIACFALNDSTRISIPLTRPYATSWTLSEWTFRATYLSPDGCSLVVEATTSRDRAWKHTYGYQSGVGVTWIGLPTDVSASPDVFVLAEAQGILTQTDEARCSAR